MEISGFVAQPSNPVYNGAKKAEVVKQVTPKTQNAPQDSLIKQEQRISDVQRSEQQRLETVTRAATSFANTYAVSASRFTIFKDGSGQFVTRFTDLRDGKVTYIPEPDIARFIENNQARTESVISFDA